MKNIQDFYFKKAKKQHYLARSIYKLEEINNKYKIIKKGMNIMDLGCAPGSWLEYMIKIVGQNGTLVGIDLKKVTKTFPQNVHIIQGSVFDAGAIEKSMQEYPVKDGYFDVIVSDMAPSTTGQKSLDAFKSYELSAQALKIAEQYLKVGGDFITKIFMGEDFKNFLDTIKNSFDKHKVYKPKSSRSESKETYIIGYSRKDKINLEMLNSV